MDSDSSSKERSANIWAPWRMEYIDALDDGQDGCFLCRYKDDPANDRDNLVFWRGRRSLAVLNRFPYTGGHSMIAPLEHLANLGDLDEQTMLEMMRMLRDAQQLLTEVIRAEGFNVGMNIGRCAGAGLPGHLHIHIVPRWPSDTNFITVFSQARVIPITLESLYEQIVQASKNLNLPRLDQ